MARELAAIPTAWAEYDIALASVEDASAAAMVADDAVARKRRRRCLTLGDLSLSASATEMDNKEANHE